MKKICTKTFAWVIALMALCFVLPMGALALDGDGQGGSAANEGTEVTKSLSIVKKSTEDEAYGQGQVIRYSIIVKNTGNQTLTGIVITDSNASAVIGEGTDYTVENNTAKIASLEPDATVTVNASYTVTCDDIKAGKVDNTVTATLNEDATINIMPATDKVVDLDTSLSVMTLSDATASVGLGQMITYTIAVVNDGNVPYTNVEVVDELAKFTTTIDTLAVSHSRVFTVTYVVSSDDMDRGRVVNTVTAKADSIKDPKSGEDKTPEGSDEAKDFTDIPVANLAVEKTITNAKTDGAPFKLGETINYSITVQNNGNVPIANVVVEDDLTGLEENIDSLAVDAKKTFTTSYTVQESDLGSGDYGKVTNTVTASGTAPKAADPERQPADPTAKSSIDAKTSIRLVITANDSTVAYDGEPHGEDGYTVTGLKDGHDLSVTINGTATNIGTYTGLLVPADAVVKEGDKDVTSHYEITYVPGTLEITAADEDDSAADDADEGDADKDGSSKKHADKDDDSAADEASDGTPRTGDTTNALLPVGMIAVAGAAMALAMRTRRRGQE